MSCSNERIAGFGEKLCVHQNPPLSFLLCEFPMRAIYLIPLGLDTLRRELQPAGRAFPVEFNLQVALGYGPQGNQVHIPAALKPGPPAPSPSSGKPSEGGNTPRSTPS